MAFTFQIVLHYEGEKQIITFTRTILDDYKAPEIVKTLALPVTGILGHMTFDGLFSEGYMGSYQILRGGLKLGALILMDDQKNWSYDTWIAFWALLPDIWDKGLNRNDFHHYVPERYLISVDREGEETLEDWIVFDTVTKKFVIRKVPAGTIMAVEMPIGGK